MSKEKKSTHTCPAMAYSVLIEQYKQMLDAKGKETINSQQYIVLKLDYRRCITQWTQVAKKAKSLKITTTLRLNCNEFQLLFEIFL